MSKRQALVPARQAHIELLRARAAYERQALAVHTHALGQTLSPKRWFSQLLHPSQDVGAGGGQRAASFLGQGLSLAAQYPYLAASLSSMLVGKRWRWVKWLGVGLTVWQIAAGTDQDSKSTET